MESTQITLSESVFCLLQSMKENQIEKRPNIDQCIEYTISICKKHFHYQEELYNNFVSPFINPPPISPNFEVLKIETKDLSSDVYNEDSITFRPSQEKILKRSSMSKKNVIPLLKEEIQFKDKLLFEKDKIIFEKEQENLKLLQQIEELKKKLEFL